MLLLTTTAPRVINLRTLKINKRHEEFARDILTAASWVRMIFGNCDNAPLLCNKYKTFCRVPFVYTHAKNPTTVAKKKLYTAINFHIFGMSRVVIVAIYKYNIHICYSYGIKRNS